MRKQIFTTMLLGLVSMFFAVSASAAVITSYGIGGDASALETTMLTKYYVYDTETFEGLTPAAPAGMVFLSDIGPFAGNGQILDAPLYGMFNTTAGGSQYYTSSFNGGTSSSFYFNFDTASQAAGFYVSSFDTTQDFYVTLGFESGGPYTINLGAYVSESVGVGVPIYFGFESDTLLTSITFHNVPDQYGVDDVSTMNTPIPGAVWLFGTGLLGLLGYRRIRS